MLRKFGKVKRITQDRESRQAPPGQYITDKFPVLTHGPTPRIDLRVWSFRIFGLVEEERTLTWEEFMALPQIAATRDFHCVTQWSRQDNLWEGVRLRKVAGLARPKPEARFVMVHSYGGYTTNLPLETAMEEDVLFAHLARHFALDYWLDARGAVRNQRRPKMPLDRCGPNLRYTCAIINVREGPVSARMEDSVQITRVSVRALT